MLSTWAPLALMFAVGYHILSHVTGQPIWSGSLTKASMVLLFVTVPPFFLAESNHAGNLTQSVGAILVTMGLFPVFAASTNMIATMRGNASAVVDSPGATAVAAGAIMLPLFAVIGYFTGLNVMIGDGSMANVADVINNSFMYVIGGLFCLGALFHSYPLSGKKTLTGSAGMATVTIQNTAPEVTATLSATTATTQDDVSVSANGTDADAGTTAITTLLTPEIPPLTD